MPVQFGFGQGLSKNVKRLIIINVVIFLITSIFYRFGNYMNFYLGVVPALVNKGMIWQFFTYMFLHAGLGHILFNMFVLWMFGTELEHNWGSKDFLIYYFACGVGGGVLVWLTAMVGLSAYAVPTIGASGALFGLLVAYGMMWPDRPIYIWGIFPMKALHLVMLLGGIDLYNGFMKSSGNVAVFAHIGGGLIGFLYLKFGWRLTVQFESIVNKFKRSKFTVVDGGKSKSARPPAQKDSSDSHPDLDMEVDRILDKIAQSGMKSLTERERKILDRASNRRKR